MKVSEIMHSQNLVTVRPDDRLALAAQMMVWANVRHLPVVRGREVVGVLSERDVFRRNGEVGAHAAAREPVERAMRSPAVTVDPEEPLVTAISLMADRKLGCLPVVGAQGLVGILTTADLLRHELDTAIERPAAGLPPPLRTVMKAAPDAVTPETELFDAVALMSARGFRHLPVIDREHKLVGMLSDRDVRTAVGDPKRLLEGPNMRDRLRAAHVADVMTSTVLALSQDAPVTSAVEHLAHERIGALPIVDEDRRLVGIVSYVDLLQAMG
jgi:CBS domain-containing protein